MKTELFNIVVNSIRNFATMQTHDRILVPLTNMHYMYVYLSEDRTKIKYIDLERIAQGESLNRGVYCEGCPINVFTVEQIKKIHELIHELIHTRQTHLSHQFDHYLGIP